MPTKEGKLKIGYFADGPWSHKAFEKIIADPTIQVTFIVPRNDTKDLTLKRFSEQYDIDYITGAKINTPEFRNKVAAYGCDLFVSMSYNQIFKKEIINIPPLKTINCHAGKLPFYRGRNILNWVLINDEKDFGITVHYVDEGIDTGDIILQNIYPITDNDSYGSLLTTAYIGCAETLYQSLKMLQSGSVRPIKQTDIHPVGFYCGERIVGDELIDWNQTSRQIFNFVRAVYNESMLCAVTHYNGTRMDVRKVAVIKDAPIYAGVPGQVVGKTSEGIVVKTLDSTVLISDYTCEEKLKIGARLK